GSDFTPDLQLRSDALGALPHSRQAPVAGTSAALQDAWVNALSIVPKAQTKQRFVVRDLRLDIPGLCVAERISQRLPRNPVYFILDHRTHGSWHAFYPHAKRHLPPVSRSNLFTQVSHQCSHRFRQVMTCHGGDTHVRDGISAFDDCLIRPIKSTFEGRFRLHGAHWKHL